MGAQLLWLKNPMDRDERRIGVETRRVQHLDRRAQKSENRSRDRRGSFNILNYMRVHKMQLWKQLLGVSLIPTISALLAVGAWVLIDHVNQEHLQRQVELNTSRTNGMDIRIQAIERQVGKLDIRVDHIENNR